MSHLQESILHADVLTQVGRTCSVAYKMAVATWADFVVADFMHYANIQLGIYQSLECICMWVVLR